ncbi:ribosomal protein S18 [Streptomyces gilvus]|uniref:ribosomal protein S18 n=1 Tax=Streptomyces gilvus TaxID=2920937 RepID=UPI001F0FD870|nr:ribosomal protein S18 [Streptomyces sp. CME 23]MCH5677931.1 ribosomal protein S18 [Streptomyces sp. CME 23]
MSSNKTGVVAKRQRLITKAIKNALLRCVNGCGKGKPGDRFCTDCGTALPIAGGAVAKNEAAPSVPAPAFLAKSVSETPSERLPDPLNFASLDDPDPAARERAWQAEFSRRFGTPVAKAASVPDEQPFGDPSTSDPTLVLSAIHDLSDARYHSDPAIREATWNALNNHTTKGR